MQHQSPQFIRFNAVEPEETIDWLSALDVATIASTLWNATRETRPQVNKQVAKAVRKILHQIEKDEADMIENKKCMQNRFANMATVVSDEFGKGKAIIDGQIADVF